MLRFYRGLLDDDQHALLRYAEFLVQRRPDVSSKLAEPILLPPDKNESVVGALKRLSASFPMLDKVKMLNRTSTLMSDHVIHGRAKEDVIKEFEILFKEQYQILKREHKSDD